MKNYITLILFLFFIKTNLFSQDFYILNKKMTFKKDVVNEVTFNKPYNSISLKNDGDFDFSKFKILFKNSNSEDYQTLTFSKNEHLEINQSNLEVFKDAHQFVFWSEKDIELELIFQYVKPIDETQNHIQTKRNLCEEPSGIIPQNTWRAGLPEPIKGRTSTATKHCVLHHSASGNNNSNYTQLVRSYYIHHTQTNGWDDIGYNYLIADDGSIFAGRDPETDSIKQDNVLGAHFCGKNISTMGVCLIGNYDSAVPSEPMLNSLIHLLTWKYVKDTLNPNSEFPHPAVSGGLLKALVGHSDGCATKCPGTSINIQIIDFNNEVYKNYLNCFPSTSILLNKENKEEYVFPNPSKGIINISEDNFEKIKSIKIYGINSTLIFENVQRTYQLESGIYYIFIETQDHNILVKKIVVY